MKKLAHTGLIFLALGCVGPRALGPPLPVRVTDVRPPGGAPGPGIGNGAAGLRATDIMATILDRKAELGACVSAEREAAPYSTGKLLMVWDVLPTGEPTNIGVREQEAAALELSHCVARVIATMRFPSSADGLKGVVFPFKY